MAESEQEAMVPDGTEVQGASESEAVELYEVDALDQEQSQDLTLQPEEEEEEQEEGEGEGSQEEWDTDLESDDTGTSGDLVPPKEVYLQACRLLNIFPVSAILRHMGEATLNFNHHGLGPKGVKALAIALVSDIESTALELVDNLLMAEGTRYVMEMLTTNTFIQHLNLSDNCLGSVGALSISDMLLENLSLKTMKLSGNELDDAAAKYLADALPNNYVLSELDLSHNKLGEAAGEYLGQMLAINEGLEILDLSWNRLKLSGAAALCDGLKGNVTLRHLGLSWNSFGCVGAKALGETLQRNNSLEEVDLSHNHIDNKAATLLCVGLGTNDSLKILNLSFNPLNYIGALALLQSVKNNGRSAMEDLNISTVLVSEAFEQMLAATYEERSSLVVRHRGVMGFFQRKRKPGFAPQIIQDFFESRDESFMDFLQSLDKEGTGKVRNALFREAIKAAKIPVDEHQLEWFIRALDKNCTGSIDYSQLEST